VRARVKRLLREPLSRRYRPAVRDDADARDVILLIGYLTRLDETEWDARANHLLDIILDGLRRRA
jgi:hypothetical protein